MKEDRPKLDAFIHSVPELERLLAKLARERPSKARVRKLVRRMRADLDAVQRRKTIRVVR